MADERQRPPLDKGGLQGGSGNRSPAQPPPNSLLLQREEASSFAAHRMGLALSRAGLPDSIRGMGDYRSRGTLLRKITTERRLFGRLRTTARDDRGPVWLGPTALDRPASRSKSARHVRSGRTCDMGATLENSPCRDNGLVPCGTHCRLVSRPGNGGILEAVPREEACGSNGPRDSRTPDALIDLFRSWCGARPATLCH